MKNIFKRPLSSRGKDIAMCATIIALSGIPAVGVGYSYAKLSKAREKAAAINTLCIYSKIIAAQSDELIRSSDAQIKILDEKIRDIQYVENKHIADSLTNAYTQEKENILRETHAELEHNLESIYMLARKYNINLER